MTIKGYKGEVTVDSNVVAMVREYNITETVERMDSTVMGNAYESADAGLTGGTVTIGCYLEPGDAGQNALVNGASVTIILRPDGAGTGLPQKTFPAVVESVEQPQNPRENVQVNFTAWINGVVDNTPQP